MADQRDLKVLAVDVLAEIEQHGLERRALVVEHRLAVRGHAIEQAGAEPGPDRVDPLREGKTGGRRGIGGRKAERAPALIAAHHLAGEEPMIAEQAVGGRNVARRQRRPDARGRDVVVALIEQVEHLDAEAVCRPGRAQKIRRSLPLKAKMEIGAYGHAPDLQRLDEEARDEIVCGDLGKILVERHDDDAVEPERLGDAGLRLARSEPEHERRRGEHVAGVRLEGEHDGRCTHRIGAGLQRREDMLMSAVQAIEIADGDHGALDGSRGIVEPPDAMELTHAAPSVVGWRRI